MAEGVGEDQMAYLEPLRDHRQRAEHRPALELVVVDVPEQRDQVIPDEPRVVARAIGGLPHRAHLAPAHVLGPP